MNTTTEPENSKTKNNSIFKRIESTIDSYKQVFIILKWWLLGLIITGIIIILWPFFSQDRNLWIDEILIIVTILVIAKIMSLYREYNAIKQWIITARVWGLVFSAILGITLAFLWYVDKVWLFPPLIFEKIAQFKTFIGIEKDVWLNASLTTLFLALPTLSVLWIFRTQDTLEQIEKTKEQIEKSQNNTLTSILTHAMDMITSDDLKRRFTGLIQLGQLKKQTDIFNAQIDSVTRYIDLTALDLDGRPLSEEEYLSSDSQRALLMKAPLKGMDLNGAKLRGANLEFADLTEAGLIDADLTEACLIDADLACADLSGADLRGADLTGVNLKGANFDRSKYSDRTNFPDEFDSEAAGMIEVDDVQIY